MVKLLFIYLAMASAFALVAHAEDPASPATKKNTSVTGRLLVAVTINGDGYPVNCRIVKSSIPEKAALACCHTILQKWHFRAPPIPSKDQIMMVPFVFKGDSKSPEKN